MAVPEIELDSWDLFKQRMQPYMQLDFSRKRQIIFRGHANSRWSLTTTLDREFRPENDESRDAVYESLTREFRRESLGVFDHGSEIANNLEWELLARHHGVPTLMLDWTDSPWIASFFAFSDPEALQSERVAIMGFNRDRFLSEELPEVSIVNEEDAVRFNHRAIEQRGLFLRVNSIEKTVEDYLGEYLFCFTIPSSDREQVLAELDEYKINARSLFRDLQGAASTAAFRVQQEYK